MRAHSPLHNGHSSTRCVLPPPLPPHLIVEGSVRPLPFSVCPLENWIHPDYMPTRNHSLSMRVLSRDLHSGLISSKPPPCRSFYPHGGSSSLYPINPTHRTLRAQILNLSLIPVGNSRWEARGWQTLWEEFQSALEPFGCSPEITGRPCLGVMNLGCTLRLQKWDGSSTLMGETGTNTILLT